VRRIVCAVAIVACGDPDSAPPCELDSECDGLYCTAGFCAARPEWAAPEIVLGIESPTDEQSFATLRFDNLEIVFASTRAGGLGCTDLWRAVRVLSTDPFTAPELLANVNSPACEAGAMLSGDGFDLLLFRDDMAGSSIIMRASRVSLGAPFGTPVEVNELDIDAFQFGPSSSTDGLTVVFQSGPAPAAKLDVFQTGRKPSNTDFDPPRRLDELGAVGLGVGLDPTGRYLVAFDPDLEQFTLSTRDSPAAPFAMPVPITELEPNPNFPALGTPFITRDGRRLYFNRRNDDNHLEIWSTLRN